MVQYFFGEAQGVSSPSVSGRIVACSRLLLCSGLIPNWYLAFMSVWVTIVLRRCHTQYATLSKGNSKVPPRIDPHIETLLQGGYHYINIT